MDSEFEELVSQIDGAKWPEDIFGTLTGDKKQKEAAAKKIYHSFVKIVHPDSHLQEEDNNRATAAFVKLDAFWKGVQKKIENGTYGDRKSTESEAEPVHIRTKRHEYVVGSQIAEGDLCLLYHCSFVKAGKSYRGILKIAKYPRDNDLVENEARILKFLRANITDEGLRMFFPYLFDTFLFLDERNVARRVNILQIPKEIDRDVYDPKDLYSLKEVQAYYPHGVDPKDMAWMWRRILTILGTVHAHGVIHGGILPTHILVHPRQHGIILIDWSYSVLNPQGSGERINAISKEYEAWYPPQVFAKDQPIPRVDVGMAAKCMWYILGGDIEHNSLPSSVPPSIRLHLSGCLQMDARTADSSWRILEAFDEIIKRQWGERKFHEFKLPPS